MKKFRLLTPGPTSIPEKVLSKFAEPVVHHRTTIFEETFKDFEDVMTEAIGEDVQISIDLMSKKYGNN